MTLKEFADFIGTKLRVDYYHDQNQRMSASLEYVDIIDGQFSISASGGSTGLKPEKAIENFVKEIRGKEIRLRRHDGRRDDYYKVPNDLTA